MKILITGGNGFIGRNLHEYLSKKQEIYAPSHLELDLLDKECVKSFLEKHRFDIIVHTAVKGGSRKLPTFQGMVKQNLKMFFNLAENSDLFEKMIFIGSGAEYDKTKDVKDVKEEDFGKTVPFDDYGFFKYVCSKYIEKSNNIINLRVFGIFGKYEDYEIRLISNILCRVIFDLPVEINQDAIFDFIYVNDLCRIIEHFIENHSKSKFYNIGSEKHLRLTEIAEKIKKTTKKDFNVVIKNQGMNKEYTCDNSRLRNELNNFKFTEIDKAIQELYNWYLDNKNIVKKENLLKY